MRFKKRRFGKRGSYRGFKRSSRSRSSGSSNPLTVVIPAMAYGAGRSYLSNLALPLTSKLGFLGQYSDEVLFGLAGWFIAKKNLMGLKPLGVAMLTIESASIGSQLIGNVGSSTGMSSQNSLNYYG